MATHFSELWAGASWCSWRKSSRSAGPRCSECPAASPSEAAPLSPACISSSERLSPAAFASAKSAFQQTVNLVSVNVAARGSYAGGVTRAVRDSSRVRVMAQNAAAQKRPCQRMSTSIMIAVRPGGNQYAPAALPAHCRHGAFRLWRAAHVEPCAMTGVTPDAMPVSVASRHATSPQTYSLRLG
jgi:hypothetical protein